MKRKSKGEGQEKRNASTVNTSCSKLKSAAVERSEGDEGGRRGKKADANQKESYRGPGNAKREFNHGEGSCLKESPAKPARGGREQRPRQNDWRKTGSRNGGFQRLNWRQNAHEHGQMDSRKRVLAEQGE